jgi:hypothetical protein
MASVAATEARLTKPPTIVAAVAIVVFLAIVGNLVVLFEGPEGAKAASVIISLVSVGLHLLAAWGLWNLRRWGAIATVVLTAIDILTTLPFFGESPSTWFVVAIVASLVLEAVVLLLLALPASRFVFQRRPTDAR